MTRMLQMSTDKKIRENQFNQCHLCSINGDRRCTQIWTLFKSICESLIKQ